ncbi:MAG: polymerase sigma-B factor [Solirubrobacteraceae bacterium]
MLFNRGRKCEFAARDAPVCAPEMATFARAADPRAERDAIVVRYLPLARHLAAQYTRGGEPFDDVFQVACIGLVKAVDRFDPGRGVAFSSYATPTIVGEIKRYYRDRTWAIHVPRDLLELALRVERASEQLAAELGRPATAADVARRLNVREGEVRRARDVSLARWTVSTDQRRGTGDEDGATIADGIGGAEPGFEAAEHRATLQTLMRCLSARDREVMRLRFAEDLTQDEIGSLMHISQMQVSRVLRSSLERLKAVAASAA